MDKNASLKRSMHLQGIAPEGISMQVTMNAPEIAMVYDFDGTLIRGESVAPLLDDLKIDHKHFWEECDAYAYKHNIDSICGYMLKVFEKAEAKGLDLSPEYLASIGERLKLRPGLEDDPNWFENIEEIAVKNGFVVNHYIITSGIAEIVEAVPIIKSYFKKVFGSRIHRLPQGGMFPGRVVNYTNKTQYLFRISKGLLDERDEFAPNRKSHHRPVPFKNMVFVGDGFTDIPCFALMREYGGHSMAVMGSKKNKEGILETLIADDRVDYISLENHFKSHGILMRSCGKIFNKIRGE